MRPYFKCPKRPESHYAAVLNILYVCVMRQTMRHTVCCFSIFSTTQVLFCPFIKYLHLISHCLGHLKGITLIKDLL